jgi:hypothetical protein
MSALPTQVAPAAQSPAKNGTDRRRAPRIKRDGPAQLIFWPASTRTAALDVRLLDYSRTGVGVLHQEAIIIGQKFVLREPFVTRDSTCIFTVARCDKRDDGYYIIGLHATPASEHPPAAEQPQDDNEWAAIAYLAFAIIGAAAIIAMALFQR